VPHEQLSNQELIKEAYVGIRPAPGYPACPDHTVKADMFNLMQTEEIDMQLTDSFAMMPGAAVSGFYFAHPESRYFSVDKIGDDQLSDMAQRRGLAKEYLERWLASNLGSLMHISQRFVTYHLALDFHIGRSGFFICIYTS